MLHFSLRNIEVHIDHVTITILNANAMLTPIKIKVKPLILRWLFLSKVKAV